MKNINSLSDSGIDKKCLIIGNGPSVKNFNLSAVPPDVYIIKINKPEGIKYASMYIYYDKDINEYYEKHQDEILTHCQLVGFKHKKLDYTNDRCNYYYSLQDVEFGDTGYHALQIADKIMKFSEIYLIGFDYTCDLTTYHFNEITTSLKKIYRFLKHSITVVQRYHMKGWQGDIYNCNEQSALKAFKYKNIL